MWAVFKCDGDGYLWYVGSNGNWSSDSLRAARWPDRRDAWQAVLDNDYVSRAHTVWLDNVQVDPNQIVPEEV
jgi:hypothetical protein